MESTKRIVGDLIFRDECYRLVGICMNIHMALGTGFTEVVYKDAIEVELQNANIPFKREVAFKIPYGNIILPHRFIADFLVYDSIIVEIKASSQFHPENFRQTLNYLKTSQIQLGILINFGEAKLKFKRIICTHQPPRITP